MTPEEAKRILAFYRPGTADQDDPDFAEPLDMADPGRQSGRRVAQVDPELSQWFREHCAAFQGVRGKFQEIQPPPALKDQILAEFKSHVTPVRSRRPLVLACVAGVLVMAGLLTLLIIHREHHDFSVYRERMMAKTQGNYTMDVQTNNLAAINTYLTEKHAPLSSLALPSLKGAKPIGCAVIDVHGSPVTMICFHTGRPLPPNEVADLWLFVANADDVIHAPGASHALSQDDRMATAAWSQEGKLYMLGVLGDERVLDKYF